MVEKYRYVDTPPESKQKRRLNLESPAFQVPHYGILDDDEEEKKVPAEDDLDSYNKYDHYFLGIEEPPSNDDHFHQVTM